MASPLSEEILKNEASTPTANVWQYIYLVLKDYYVLSDVFAHLEYARYSTCQNWR